MRNDTRLGIWLMIATTAVFAIQDGFSRHLASEYNTLMVVMIRYWFFAAFVVVMAVRQSGSIRAAARTAQPGLQTLRGLLLAGEICVAVLGFVVLGLVESHAIFTSYPLLIAALSGPLLGEVVGWRRWAAIGVGFLGVLIILQPGVAVFSPWALVPLLSSLMFAFYGLLTRYVARQDSAATSFFWTGVVGAVFMTAIGIWQWEPMTPRDSGLHGDPLRAGRDRSLAADQVLRGGRGRGGAALCLSATGLCLDHRFRGLWRGYRAEHRDRRGHRGGRRAVHPVARAACRRASGTRLTQAGRVIGVHAGGRRGLRHGGGGGGRQDEAQPCAFGGLRCRFARRQEHHVQPARPQPGKR